MPFLLQTELPIPVAAAKKALERSGGIIPKSTHEAAWWEARTRGMDFSKEDRINPVAFNLVVWKGLKGNLPYPAARSGADLRQNRGELLQKPDASGESTARRAKGRGGAE